MNIKTYLIVLLTLTLLGVAACQNPEKLLPKDGGSWRISVQVEELYFGGGLVGRHAAQDEATLVFGEDGIATLTDSTGESQYPWIYDSQNETLTLEGYRIEFEIQGTFYTRESFPFKIMESKSDTQLWRYEEAFITFNPFTQDSSDALIVVQWEMNSD